MLPDLYRTVAIPPAVARELSHANTPEVITSWMAAGPTWLEIRQPSHVDQGLARNAGEREAISLALELRADALLIDDLRGRKTAERLGLKVAGTVAILENASERGLISLRDAFDRLRQTDFYLSAEIISAALDRDRDRRRE